MSAHHFILWVKNIPPYGYTIFRLPSHLWMDTCVVSTFRLLQIVLVRIFVYKFLFALVISLGGYIPRGGIAEPYGHFMFISQLSIC